MQVLSLPRFLDETRAPKAGDTPKEQALIPERELRENIYRYINRASHELRETRQRRLEEQCQRIATKAKRHDYSEQFRSPLEAEANIR